MRVLESLPRDIGKARARLSMTSMVRIGAKPGDVLLLSGRKEAAATAWPSDQDDTPSEAVRLDGSMRRNLGAALNDYIEVSKGGGRQASSVVLATVSQGVNIDTEFEAFVKNRIKGMPLVEGNTISVVILGSPMNFQVVRTSPRGVAIVNEATSLHVKAGVAGTVTEVRVTYDDVGGLKPQLGRLREIVELPLRMPELFGRLGIEPPRGVLLYGPPGCGKTMIAKALATESQAKFFAINGPEIMSKYYGETEAKLRDFFKEAKESAPSIIFIDEIDAIAPRREDVFGEVEKRVVAQLLSLMDGLSERGNVMVIGATNRIDDVDLALRRPGRFDREVEIGVPNTAGRLEVLQIHTRGMPLDSDLDLKRLSEITNGYTGADLTALCREAALNALRRVVPHADSLPKIPAATLEKLKVALPDFLMAHKDIVPTALREFYVEMPTVKWEDVGGLDGVKEALSDNLAAAIRRPQDFKRLGIEPPRGVLLYGPPGCGKTTMAKALATESRANMIVVKGPEILSRWVGESEKGIREIFRKARSSSPCLVFFDEIDSLGKARGEQTEGWAGETVLSQMLTEMDALYSGEGVFVVAATNRPDILDPALLRPGRLGMLVYVPPPDELSRLKILKIKTARMPVAADVDLRSVARASVNYTGADLEAACRAAGLSCLKRGDDRVSMKDFELALSTVRPSFTEEMQQWYREIEKKLSASLLRARAAPPYT
ncbi:MAG: CDC48 family AAA ATPase [Nitrososphaerota archaeon]|nr:CDC48 family AAA ATPase [Nitrososphaerota archaeon]MDG6939381.1 CDC48 family AAA ATPase [Nitrososphaerota archaeon]